MLDPDSDTVTELTDEHCWSLLGHDGAHPRPENPIHHEKETRS